MSKVVIYAGKYGTTYRYASEFSKHTGIELLKFDEVKDINQYDYIVYFGAIYAGIVTGLKKTLSGINSIEGKRIVIATVGLTDPLDRKNVENIRNSMKSQIPNEIYDASKIVHLRGGINYSKMTFMHKRIMGLIYRKMKSLPKEERNDETEAMLKMRNQVIDYVDINALQEMYEE